MQMNNYLGNQEIQANPLSASDYANQFSLMNHSLPQQTHDQFTGIPGMAGEGIQTVFATQPEFGEKTLLDNSTTFMMKKGKLVVDTPEFMQFKRQNVTIWGAVAFFISQMEKFFTKYNVNYVYVSA